MRTRPRPRPRLFHTLLGVLILIMPVMPVTVAAAAAAVTTATAESGGQPSTAPARAVPPNILLAIADDWSVHAGAYGTPWVRTPAFDRVAREGLLFHRAYTPSAKCAPSRSCLLTGRNPWQLEAAANHVCFFPPRFKTWPEALAEHGWHVGYTQKGWGPGVATNAQGQPRLMTGKPFNRHKTTPPTPDIGANDYAANFQDFLEAAPPNQPWCFWYGSTEPHRAYEFGSGVAKGGRKLSDIDRVPAYWPDTDIVRHDLLDYAFEVEHFDRHLGRMLALLESRGMLENTLVVVTSDHGMPFPRVKGNTHEIANHVPLAIRWPAGIQRPGRGVDDFVSFIDFAPTFLELAGLSWPDSGLEPSPGRSLTDVFQASPTEPRHPARTRVLLGRERNDVGRPHDAGYPVRAIVKEGQFYARNFEPTRWPAGNPETGYLDCDGGATKSLILERHRADPTDEFWRLCFGHRPAEEFYQLDQDPDGVRNLAESPAHQGPRQALRQELFAALGSQDDPRPRGDGAAFDAYPYADPAQRDFHARFLRGEKVRAGWVRDSDFEPRPHANVIFILGDDHGSVDAGCYGAKDLQTPSLDRLASRGVRFTQFYAAAPVCSPSRAGLLTGRYPWLAGMPGNSAGPPPESENHLRGLSSEGLPSDEVTLAEMFRAAGYATAHLGKWHLGYGDGHRPLDQGFDRSFGHMGGCIDNFAHFFYWAGPSRHDLWENNQRVRLPGRFFPDLLVDKAREFIARHRDQPFFLYLAMNLPHYPYQGDAHWLERYRHLPHPRNLYAAFLSSLDERIGQILDYLDQSGLRERTIVVYQSDNGHSVEERAHGGGGSSGPYRGAKFSLFEGGIRLPAVISWPGHLPEGTVRSSPAHACDWMPTLAELTRVPLPQRPLHGTSLASQLRSDPPPSPPRTLHWRSGQQWAVRQGPWKLIHQPTDPTRTTPLPEADRTWFLANLDDDPGETTNLAERHPDIVGRLQALAKSTDPAPTPTAK